MEVLSQLPVYLSGGLGVNDKNVILIKYIYLNMYTYPQFVCFFVFFIFFIGGCIYWGSFSKLQIYRTTGLMGFSFAFVV